MRGSHGNDTDDCCLLERDTVQSSRIQYISTRRHGTTCPDDTTNLGKLAMPFVLPPSDLAPSLQASSCFLFNAFNLSLRFSASPSSESILSCVDITVALFITHFHVATLCSLRYVTMNNNQEHASIHRSYISRYFNDRYHRLMRHIALLWYEKFNLLPPDSMPLHRPASAQYLYFYQNKTYSDF